jgi:hypothetical protein
MCDPRTSGHASLWLTMLKILEDCLRNWNMSSIMLLRSIYISCETLPCLLVTRHCGPGMYWTVMTGLYQLACCVRLTKYYNPHHQVTDTTFCTIPNHRDMAVLSFSNLLLIESLTPVPYTRFI